MTTKKGREKAVTVKQTSTMAVKSAYEYLKELTVDFTIRPGEQINESEIANQLQMSRVPVREALNRLVIGGLVSFDPGKGFFCRKFSETEMKDLYEVRLDLEIGAVKQACHVGKDEEIGTILDECKKLAEDYQQKEQQELILLDEAFHIKLATLGGNMERVALLQNVYERIRFVRKINIEEESSRASLIGDHIRLIEAVLAHDEEKAIGLVSRHLGVDSQELKENIRTGMLRIYAADMT